MSLSESSALVSLLRSGTPFALNASSFGMKIVSPFSILERDYKTEKGKGERDLAVEDIEVFSQDLFLQLEAFKDELRGLFWVSEADSCELADMNGGIYGFV
ncbi:hypothetical protein ACFX2H_042687 [Malus domestica]